ncbi:hypothetical protein [Singulisphaera sp. PoT]|uniref:hypothetical protein n=1 Tax=Singulisphaera sp. PoT TaxID=3411797 RepID=UPI003BF499F7
MKTRKQFEPYVRHIANLMRLRDWTVSISDEGPGNPDYNARVELIYGRKVLVVYLSNGFLQNSEEEQRHTICHEMTHALFAQMHQYLCNELGGNRFVGYKLLMEYGIDGVADVLSVYLPLPSKLKGRKMPVDKSPISKATRSNKATAKAEERAMGLTAGTPAAQPKPSAKAAKKKKK